MSQKVDFIMSQKLSFLLSHKQNILMSQKVNFLMSRKLSLNKQFVASTDFCSTRHVILAINLQDTIKAMKSNLNEKVSSLTVEVQKLNTSFESSKSDFSKTRIKNNSFNERLLALEKQCWANVQYSRRECLEITSIRSSVSDKDLEEVVCKAITKAGVDINANDV